MDNINFDENTINKLKDMMNSGELNSVLQNFSSSMSKNQNSKSDFSNIDMNTIMKIKSVMDKMNSEDDPRSNLLHSLKPYLRDGRKQKIDQYANLLNFAKIAEIFKADNNKENNQ